MSEQNLEIITIFVTVPDLNKAESLSALLVEKRLAACVKILPGVTSIYRWEGKIERSSEVQIIAKSIQAKFDEFCLVVAENHPYEVPEIVAVPTSSVAKSYRDWVVEELVLARS